MKTKIKMYTIPVIYILYASLIVPINTVFLPSISVLLYINEQELQSKTYNLIFLYNIFLKIMQAQSYSKAESKI